MLIEQQQMQPPLTSAAVGSVPDEDLGIAAATNRLTSQLGVGSVAYHGRTVFEEEKEEEEQRRKQRQSEKKNDDDKE